MDCSSGLRGAESGNGWWSDVAVDWSDAGYGWLIFVGVLYLSYRGLRGLVWVCECWVVVGLSWLMLVVRTVIVGW